jgi:hypothetical protein
MLTAAVGAEGDGAAGEVDVVGDDGAPRGAAVGVDVGAGPGRVEDAVVGEVHAGLALDRHGTRR